MSYQGEQHPGVTPAASQTQGFRLNHTMLRVKDPERALAFYSKVFGMQVLRRLDFEEMQFSLYFQGFGHICFSVPDLEAAQAWFDEHDVTFVKRADQGKMKDVIFVKDADGYWIEVIQADRMAGMGD